MSTTIKSLIPAALVLYLILLCWHGYRFNRSDQVAILALAEHLDHPEVFAQDFYTTTVSDQSWNERSGIITLTRLVRRTVWGTFVLHFFFSAILFIGLLRIGYEITEDLSQAIIGSLVLLIPLYGINLGGNEVYYNFLIGSLVAKSFAIWALWFFLFKKQLLPAFALLALAALFQAIVALQPAVLFVAALVICSLITGTKVNKKELIHLGLGLLLVGLVTLPFVWSSQTPMDNDLYFSIQRFRNAHHLFPQHFGLLNYFVFFCLLLALVAHTIRHKSSLFLAFVISICAAVALYAFNLLYPRIPLILTAQWFKSTIWLEVLGVFTIARLVPRRLIPFKPVLLLSLCLLFSLGWRFTYSGWKHSHPIDLPHQVNNSAEIDLALQYKGELSDKLLLLPPSYISFKYITKCNTYVDFKSIPHAKGPQQLWYNRLQKVYGDLSSQVGLTLDDYRAISTDTMRLNLLEIDGYIKLDEGASPKIVWLKD